MLKFSVSHCPLEEINLKRAVMLAQNFTLSVARCKYLRKFLIKILSFFQMPEDF